MARDRAALGSALLAAVERRLPALTRLRQPESLPIRLHRRRIYVVPSRFGLALGVLLFVMLIGALNYSNNPAVLLTCFLAAAAGASVFAGFRVLSGVALTQLRAEPAHAGTPLTLTLHFDAAGRARPNLRLVSPAGEEIAFAVPADGGEVHLALPTERRGWLRPGRWKLVTDHPLGLFTVWSWLNPDLECLVWPEPERDPPALPAGAGETGFLAARHGPEEHGGLRDYRPGDPARSIAWKASARHDRLLAHDVDRRAGEALILDYAQLRGLDHEARIRRLTAWVLAAEADRRGYALRLPEDELAAGLGTPHRDEALRALALLPTAAQRFG